MDKWASNLVKDFPTCFETAGNVRCSGIGWRADRISSRRLTRVDLDPARNSQGWMR